MDKSKSRSVRAMEEQVREHQARMKDLRGQAQSHRYTMQEEACLKTKVTITP